MTYVSMLLRFMRLSYKICYKTNALINGEDGMFKTDNNQRQLSRALDRSLVTGLD